LGQSFQAFRTMNSRALQYVRQNTGNYFKPIDTVLDFGCGPGDITFEIARQTQQVYATDISEGMIEAAKHKASEQNIRNIRFIKTNLFDGNFETSSLDMITAFNVLQYIANKKQLFAKFHELLKPQGFFISSTACLRERKSVLRFLISGLSTLNIVPEILLYKTSELEDEIRGAGFTIVAAFNIAKIPERLIIASKV
jgi:2-polyprenyl-3-methyl-5-hydroxy-6-metoxy-1,4-benzoquinol methylase